jgi:hypothetical protein
MITVDEYCKFLKDAEDKIEDIDRRITYRKIELVGARGIRTSYERCMPLAEEEQRTIDNDLVLARLMYDKQEYVNRIEFVKTRAEYPEIRE